MTAPIAERLRVLAKCVLPSFSDELHAIAEECERLAGEMREPSTRWPAQPYGDDVVLMTYAKCAEIADALAGRGK